MECRCQSNDNKLFERFMPKSPGDEAYKESKKSKELEELSGPQKLKYFGIDVDRPSPFLDSKRRPRLFVLDNNIHNLRQIDLLHLFSGVFDKIFEVARYFMAPSLRRSPTVSVTVVLTPTRGWETTNLRKNPGISSSLLWLCFRLTNRCGRRTVGSML
jgi:hypothetical protein